jgi:RNA methyltransferase, TrmH family
MEKIYSLQNPKIKNLIKLHKTGERNEQKLFLVEGLKEIKLAIEAEYTMDSLFWCPELGISLTEIENLNKKNNSNFEITQKLFSRIAYRDNSDGLMSVFHQKRTELKNLTPEKNALVLVLESVEKPGNLGAILRTADAASVFAVLVCDQKTDIFNPNIIRSSIGCLFTNRVIICSNKEAIAWLRKNKILIYSAALRPESGTYDQFDYKNVPVAMVLGTEAEGLSEFWLENCDEKIIIPMLGKIDSLNVSNSAAILAYEVMRQRGFKKIV